MGPLYGIGLALDPPHPVQRVTVEEALNAYTKGSAYAAFAEDEVGEIAPGKWADLVILSADPRKTPWPEIKVEATFVAGELVFSR
jgi:predicted amidohydrolase YtcJ